MRLNFEEIVGILLLFVGMFENIYIAIIWFHFQ